jgi:hypothetical protein
MMNLENLNKDITVTEYKLTLETTDPPTLGLLKVVTAKVWREDEHMFAACPEYGIIAQANDANGALIELNRLVLLRGAREKRTDSTVDSSVPMVEAYDPYGTRTQSITVDGHVYSRTRHNNLAQEVNDLRHYRARDGYDVSEILCGRCLHDSFHITYGNYECIAVCSQCGNSDIVYDG